MARRGDEERPILIKRIKKVEGGHHGGAWKVAYADFTTAMMAFFMLLWLLNVTTEEQRQGLADYFAPTSASTSGASGAGGVLGGTALSKDGAMNSGAVVLSMPMPSPTPEGSSTGKDANQSAEETKFAKEEVEWQKALADRETVAFEQLEAQLKQAIQDVPDLADLSENLVVEVTEDGLRIQLIDKDRRSMFKAGSAELFDYAKALLQTIAQKIQGVKNRISITGHTDAKPFSGPDGYSNWELSSDRANAARRALRQAGVSEDRFSMVRGMASAEPLLPDSPARPENRRITILLLREAPVAPPSR